MIYQKIVEIMNELTKIGKIKREEIVPTMLPILASKKLVIRPIEISDYRYMNNNASFNATYELVDTESSNENNEYASIIIKLPAGGSDSEGKGRATYMASTGVFRQVLQQAFLIPILEPDEENTGIPGNSGIMGEDSDNMQFPEEFEDDNSIPEEENQAKTIDELTVEDLDAQFENF